VAREEIIRFASRRGVALGRKNRRRRAAGTRWPERPWTRSTEESVARGTTAAQSPAAAWPGHKSKSQRKASGNFYRARSTRDSFDAPHARSRLTTFRHLHRACSGQSYSFSLDHVFMFSKDKMLAGVSGLKDSPALARVVAIIGKNIEPIISDEKQGEPSDIIWRD
jgi:hypothetical protein